MHKKPVLMILSEAAAESQNLFYQGPSFGHPWARGRSKFSTVLKVLGTILSTYRVPSKWSHSCCKTRACQPEAVILIGSPLRSKPVTSTSRYRSTTALNPSTLQDVIAIKHVNGTKDEGLCISMFHTIILHKNKNYTVKIRANQPFQSLDFWNSKFVPYIRECQSIESLSL